MNRDTSKDKLKQYLPTDEELDKALGEAMRDGAQSLEHAAAPNLRTLRPNSLIKGKVVAVDMDRVTVDMAYKAEGVIPASEFGGNPPKVVKIEPICA
jgi:ribosomal protein S1